MDAQAASRLDLSGPQLRADQAGYVLGTVAVDGFEDRLDLEPGARRQIAEWAAAFGHELSAAQTALLAEPAPVDETARAILAAATRNREVDVPLACQFGLDEQLDEQQLLLVREPWRGLAGDERREYPLSVGEIAELTGSTAKQVRGWEQAGLLPGYRIDGRRQFFSAAVMHAFALRTLERFQVAALVSLRGAEETDPFVRLVEHTLELRTRERAEHSGIGAQLFAQARRLFRRVVEPEPASPTVEVDAIGTGTFDTDAFGTVMARMMFARAVTLYGAVEEAVHVQAIEHTSEHSMTFVTPLVADAGRCRLHDDYIVVVHPGEPSGWSLSVNLGFSAARQRDAVRFGRELSDHLGGGVVRLYSRSDGRLLGAKRER